MVPNSVTEDKIVFIGIAIGGKKFAGKDLILDYLVSTRASTQIVRCKTPIVEAYERIVGHPYDKGRDDAELIVVSREQIRGGPNGNDNICGDYLLGKLPAVSLQGYVPLVPDMRRKPENDACIQVGMLCLKVEASEEVRAARGMRRDGHLRNWDPNDATETEVDDLHYHYVIDNNRDDGGAFAIEQLEDYLRRAGARFKAQAA